MKLKLRKDLVIIEGISSESFISVYLLNIVSFDNNKLENQRFLV